MAAGLGFKDFVTGEVLTAADVDGYLMQNIWVFANATARDAAVTSPQEGNACYLKDTDAVMTYSGSAWVAVGATKSFVGCKLTGTGTVSIANSTLTTVNFASEQYDTDSFHSTSVNTSRVTIPTGKGGYYRINAMGRMAGLTAGFFAIKLAKNGTDVSNSLTDPYNGSGSNAITDVLNLAATDYIEMKVFQSSGSAQNLSYEGGELYTYLIAEYLGA